MRKLSPVKGWTIVRNGTSTAKRYGDPKSDSWGPHYIIWKSKKVAEVQRHALHYRWQFVVVKVVMEEVG